MTMKRIAIALLIASSLSTGVAYAQSAKQACRQECQQQFQQCMRDATEAEQKKACFETWKACGDKCR